MRIRVWMAFLAVTIAAGTGFTQAPANIEIKVAWEHLTNNPNGVPGFPFMTTRVGNKQESDGTSDMDLIGSLRRYDENRLMLFVVENGINETDPNHDAAMAAKFPDRTVWWINPNDGSPMGIAITFPIKPWPDTDEYIKRINDAYGDHGSVRPDLAQEEFPKIDVDAEGNLYLTDKHHLLRYTPDGKGGFTGPTLAYNYQPENESKVITPDGREGNYLHWRGFNMIDLQIKGEGANKIMTTTRRHWADNGGLWYYTSADGGAAWTAKYYNGQGTSLTGIGGGGSLPVISPDGKEEWMFCTGFPGSSDVIRRYVRPAGSTEQFAEDTEALWSPGVDENPAVGETEKYRGQTKVDVAAHDSLPYIVVATIPFWQSRDKLELDPPPTAWLAVLSTGVDPNNDFVEGDFLTAHPIQFTEKDELGGADYVDNWAAAYSSEVNIYVGQNYPAYAFEILWCGGTMGYGRYVVGNVPTPVPDWPLY